MTAFLTGALSFVAAHAIEVLMWRTLFEPAGEHAAWFLNSGRAVAFAAACLFLAALTYSRLGKRSSSAWGVDALNIAAGAVVAMAVVLVSIGPGTIFPIVLAVGALVAAVASAAGALLGTML